MSQDVLAPCGLYCAVCLDNVVNHVCHGCGCNCGKCAGDAHYNGCEIAQCASSKGFETCAECADLPCTALIHFAYHPFAIHHLQAIEVLRRVQKVGKAQVLEELRTTFADEETRLQWAFIEDYGGRRHREFQQWKSSLQEQKGDERTQ
jgi:hypothetical protein